MIDLGAWASEGYRVPLVESPEGLMPAEFLDLDLEGSTDEQN